MATGRFKKTLIPFTLHDVPALPEPKEQYYVDFPVVANETVTNRPFFINPDSLGWTYCTSDDTVTTISKWNGNSWTDVTPGYNNPEFFYGTGFYSITTTANAYVTITEHRDPNVLITKDRPR